MKSTLLLAKVDGVSPFVLQRNWVPTVALVTKVVTSLFVINPPDVIGAVTCETPLLLNTVTGSTNRLKVASAISLSVYPLRVPITLNTPPVDRGKGAPLVAAVPTVADGVVPSMVQC